LRIDEFVPKPAKPLRKVGKVMMTQTSERSQGEHLGCIFCLRFGNSAGKKKLRCPTQDLPEG
jgi:hypothetical protein